MYFRSTILISDEDSDEWTPAEPKLKAPTTTAGAPAVPGEKKAAPKRTAKPKEPKAPKQPKPPKEPKVPKPRAPRKTAAERKTQASKVVKVSSTSVLAGTKRKNIDEGDDDKAAENKEEKHTDCGPSTKMKKEVRL